MSGWDARRSSFAISIGDSLNYIFYSNVKNLQAMHTQFS